MAENFELEKLNKEGVKFTRKERQQNRPMLRNVETIRELLKIKQRQTRDTVKKITKESRELWREIDLRYGKSVFVFLGYNFFDI